MWWRRKKQQVPSQRTSQGPPLPVGGLTSGLTVIMQSGLSIAQPECFKDAHIQSVTFTVDRLPFLKNLLARYNEREAEDINLRRHDTDLRVIFEPLARDFARYFRDEFEKKAAAERFPHYETVALDIILKHTEVLYTRLSALRAQGWDGRGIQYDSYMEDYRSDVRWQLQKLTDALDAGNKEVTLTVPAQFAQEYEGWLINTLAWAVRKGKGPAAEKAGKGQ